MNVFFTDFDPNIAAQNLCDKHIPKMLLESAQMLSNAYHIFKLTDPPYRLLMKNHPCSRWTVKSEGNFSWLLTHAYEISREYTKRFHKTHACLSVLNRVSNDMSRIQWGESSFTKPPQVMPLIYRNEGTIVAYRSYYKGEKLFAKWNKGTKKPEWYDDHKIEYSLEGIKNYLERGLAIPDHTSIEKISELVM